MKNIFILILSLSLAACSGSAVTPTVDELNPAVEFLVEVQRAEATGESIKATQMWIGGQLTATQQVKDAHATESFAAVTQMAFAAETTATHEAFSAHQASTEQAVAVERVNTQQAWAVTVTAQVRGTETAVPQTATANAINAAYTQQSYQSTATMAQAYGVAQATSANAGAQSVVYALERERITNNTRAIVPWLAFIVAIALVSVLAIRASRVRVVQKDAFGAWPGLVVDGKAMDMDTSTSMRQLPDGSIEFKQGSTSMTEQTKKVQIVRALPAQSGSKADLESIFPLQREPRFGLLGEGEYPPAELLNPEALKVIEADWKDEKDG